MGLVVDSYRFAAAASTDITDSFDRANSTTTMGNADTGETWVPNFGTWGINGNQAYSNVGNPQITTVIDSGLADCTVEVTIATQTDCGLCLRSTDTSNHFVTNTGSLFRKQNGSFTNIGTITGGVTTGMVLKAVLNGTSIKIFTDGVERLSVTSSFNQTATEHGLRIAQGGLGDRLDDFSITA